MGDEKMEGRIRNRRTGGLAAAVLYFTIRKIVRDYREKDYAIHRTELLFILTPGLTGLMVCALLRITIDTAENRL